MITTIASTVVSSIAFCAPITPNPTQLITLPSAKGQALVYSSEHKANLFNLLGYFVTEKGLTYCGPASIVMQLNALGIAKPITPSHAPYKIFNQNNIFYSSKILKIITPSQVGFHGMNLTQATQLLNNLNVTAKAYSADKVTIKLFRELLIKVLDNKSYGIIANFSRADIGEKHGAHFSPLAAYDQKSDRVLILDVARYKYPPVWAKVTDLLAAMQTRDTKSKKYRGFIIISK